MAAAAAVYNGMRDVLNKPVIGNPYKEKRETVIAAFHKKGNYGEIIIVADGGRMFLLKEIEPTHYVYEEIAVTEA